MPPSAETALNCFMTRVVWPARRIQEDRAEEHAAFQAALQRRIQELQRRIQEDRAEDHAALQAALQAALLPLVRHQADIVQAVVKHYQWAVRVDKVCELEKRYEQMISKAETTLTDMRKIEDEAWSSYGPCRNDVDFYGLPIMSDTIEERDALSSSSDCEAFIHETAVELYALKQDVVKCYSFEHPDTARSVRKIEGAKMAHRIHKLLSCIDGSLETWLRMDGLAWCLKRPGVAWALKKQLKMPRISARHETQ